MISGIKSTVKETPCIHCGKIITINIYARQSLATCDDCASDRCEMCNEPTGYKRRMGVKKRRFCKDCLPIWKKEYQEEHGFENSRKGGLISTAKSCKRSKNEIHFATLCQETFDNVSCNEAFFEDKNGNRWDADIILHNYKLAVLWDGNFHRQQIHASQSLTQVQSRDKIKRGIIEANNYSHYTIEDPGKENPTFVQEQFAIFCAYIKSLPPS